ncbi:protein PELOTA 1-like [Senna tora]|uniref:Protein PELOTA 1-like n=1 Tax=Senna tora TaxID=362788 RepID=A0A835CC41_9FABA|nr:protein PELOTA 1-like [Senna tora]
MVTIIPEQLDDLWIIYNLVVLGNIITTDSTRKSCPNSTNDYATPTRVNLNIHMKVMSRDFQKDNSTVRILVRTVGTKYHLLARSYRSFTLQTHKLFKLTKKKWDPAFVTALIITTYKPSGVYLAGFFLMRNKRRFTCTIKSVVIASGSGGSMKDEFWSFLLSKTKAKEIEDEDCGR